MEAATTDNDNEVPAPTPSNTVTEANDAAPKVGIPKKRGVSLLQRLAQRNLEVKRKEAEQAAENGEEEGEGEEENEEMQDDDSDDEEDDTVCEICKGGQHSHLILLCDHCDRGFHTYCLTPAVDGIPEGDWFCPKCLKKKGSEKRKRKRPAERISSPESSEELAMSDIELILARKKKGEIVGTLFGPFNEDEDDDDDGSGVKIILDKEMFLIKRKQRSYRDCEWVSQDYLQSFKDGTRRIKHFAGIERQMNEHRRRWFHGDHSFFNPDFMDMDRVIAHKKLDNEHQSFPATEYLVKWRSLPYDQCTWEARQRLEGVPRSVECVRRYHEICHGRKPRPPHDKDMKFPLRTGQLRDYQLEGVKWLVFNWKQQRNSLLADEMGLGKTLQCISMFNHMASLPQSRCSFLVVAPLSTIFHWKREVERFTHLHPVLYHGSEKARNIIRDNEFFARDRRNRVMCDHTRFDVLITTYETVVRDVATLAKFPFMSMVLDEAHRLKNRASVTHKAVRRLCADHCVLLSGTPIQNDIEELFSLLNFMDPPAFRDFSIFAEKFGDMKETKQVADLKKELLPYVLRRLKTDIRTDPLPPREECVVEVEMSTTQKSYYKAVYERNGAMLASLQSDSGQPVRLGNIAMQLRKTCNHPFLLDGVEEAEVESRELQTDDEVMRNLVHASGKLVLLDKLLPELQKQGHRVLLFSTMTRVLDILEDYVRWKKHSYERLDGSMSSSARQEAVDRFCSDDSCFLFLLSTRAGGLGLNLVAADTVVIFDSDWNPQMDVQAQARCHRIGQKQRVKTYRLVTTNSYEWAMFQRASAKLAQDEAVMHSMRGGEKTSGEWMKDAQEIQRMLKAGAYHAFLGESSEEKAKSESFEADSLQSILGRCKVVTVDSDNSALTSSALSKAVFVPKEGGQVDMDDPEFWTKVGFAPAEEHADGEEQGDASLASKRSRQPRQLYNAGDGEVEVDSDAMDEVLASDWEEEQGEEGDKDKKRRRKKKSRKYFAPTPLLDDDYQAPEKGGEFSDSGQDASESGDEDMWTELSRLQGNEQHGTGFMPVFSPKLVDIYRTGNSNTKLSQPLQARVARFLDIRKQINKQHPIVHPPRLPAIGAKLMRTSDDGRRMCDCVGHCNGTVVCDNAPSTAKDRNTLERVTILNFNQAFRTLELGPSLFSWRCTPSARLMDQVMLYKELSSSGVELQTRDQGPLNAEQLRALLSRIVLDTALAEKERALAGPPPLESEQDSKD